MPIKLNLFEYIGLFRVNRGPGPMLEMLNMLSFKAVLTALKLNIFEAMAGKSRDIPTIANDTGVDHSGLALLLTALVTLGYVKEHDGYYAISAMTEKWLLKSSPGSIADLFYYFDDMGRRWDYLDQSIMKGMPPLQGHEWLTNHPGSWDAYHAGLRSVAALVIGDIHKKIKIRDAARRLLDLGGSHGQYCIEFCRRYPNLNGVIVDWPSAEKTALDTIALSKMANRVTFQPVDFISGDIGEGYDVALMFNIIRIFEPAVLIALFRKIVTALNSGGMIIIMDHLGHRPSSRFFKANASLILLELFNSTLGAIHDAADVISWIKDAGFVKTKYYSVRRSPGLGLVVGCKP